MLFRLKKLSFCFLILLPLITCGSSWQEFQWVPETSGSGGTALPAQEDLVFQWDMFDGSASNQVGTLNYTRSGSIIYPTGERALSTVTTDNVPVNARGFDDDGSFVGVYFQGAFANYAKNTEDFTAASWTSIGTGSASANTATAPDGNSTADTISGSASGDGLQQVNSSLTVGTSNAYVFSVYLKTSSGTATVKLVLTAT